MSPIVTAALLLAAATVVAPPFHRQLRMPTGRVRRGGRTPIAAPLLLAAGIVVVLAPVTLSTTILAGAAVIAVRRRRREAGRRRRAEGRAMATALTVMIGELRVGAHPLRAFTIAGAESAGEVGEALRSVAARAQLGADVPAGIRSVAATSSVPAHWERLGVFWQLAGDHGLALSTLMGAAQRDIAERQRFSERMHAALAGARATSAILALLPVFGVVLGELVGADPVGFLLGGGLGGWLLVIGVALICAGLLWSDRIVDSAAT